MKHETERGIITPGGGGSSTVGDGGSVLIEGYGGVLPNNDEGD